MDIQGDELTCPAEDAVLDYLGAASLTIGQLSQCLQAPAIGRQREGAAPRPRWTPPAAGASVSREQR